MNRKCNALGCDNRIGEDLFMCRQHWRMLSEYTRGWVTLYLADINNPGGKYEAEASKWRMVAQREVAQLELELYQQKSIQVLEEQQKLLKQIKRLQDEV